MRKLFIIITLFFLTAYLSGCGGGDSDSKASKRIESAVGESVDIEGDDSLEYKQEVRHFKLDGFSKSGENRWSVEGTFANIIDPDIILRSIKGASLGKDLAVNITADKGVYNRQTQSATLEGNVVVTLSDGGKVFMDYATWNAKEEEVTTGSPVRIEHSGIVLEGIGGKVRPQQEWALIDKDVKMTDVNGRVVTCDGPLEVIYKERKAILNNNVEITDKQGKMYADQVVAYFDADKREIEKIEWLGNVKAVY